VPDSPDSPDSLVERVRAVMGQVKDPALQTDLMAAGMI
jgi:hypothetical protein